MKTLVRLVALGSLLVASGCGVSEGDIAQWKGSGKGPGKLKEALANPSLDVKIRAAAGLALIEIGTGEDVDKGLTGLANDDRLVVVNGLLPLYVARMAATAGGTESSKDRSVRDAVFDLRAHADPDQKQQIDAILLDSIEKDLRSGAKASGRHSADKILTDIGVGAGPVLVRLLEDASVPFAPVADILSKVGDAHALDSGGAALVKRAAAGAGIPVPLWRALGGVGGKAAAEFLKAKVKKGSTKEALAAVQALQQKRDPTLVSFAVEIASDAKANKGVRDEMFGLLEVVGGPTAREGLLKIIASDQDEIVRYRAYEAVLVVGKGDVIASALEVFPANGKYKKDDVVDFLVKDIQKLGPSARPAVVAALSSRAPLARMVAVLALEAMRGAGEVEAAALTKLAGDKGAVPGFPPGDTVGKEAGRVAKVLHGR